MKIFDKLEDLIPYIKRKHSQIQRYGIIGMTMLRKNSGKRLILEEIKGIKLTSYTIVGERDLSIQLIATHFQFRGKKRIKYLHRLLLSDLILINVYDDRAEFFTNNNIDFSYMDGSYEGQIKAMQYWIYREEGVLRARWTSQDDNVEKRLQDLGLDQKIRRRIEPRRGIRMNKNIQELIE